MRTHRVKIEGRWLDRIIRQTGICVCAVAMSALSLAQEAGERVVLVPFGSPPKEAPLFFSATAEVSASANLETITSQQRITFKIHQGRPECLTLALVGTGEVVSVTGESIRDWAVRVGGDGARFLDVRPELTGDAIPGEVKIEVKTLQGVGKDFVSLMMPAPGPASGFSLSVDIVAETGADLRLVKADGVSLVDSANGMKFLGSGIAALDVQISPSGIGMRGLELSGASVDGVLSEDAKAVSFRLVGTAKSSAPGSSLDLLGGGAAVSGGVSGEGWHVALRENGGYELVAERQGEMPVKIEFVVPVTRSGDWSSLVFSFPSGVVVPVTLSGLGEGVSFDRSKPVVPGMEGVVWRGFLPADGGAEMSWKRTGTVEDGALFFSSTETTDVRIGSGLMRQMTVMDLRVLQGKLPSLDLGLEGAGEILSVTGDMVLGWSVSTEGGNRKLEIRLNRAIEGAGRIVVEAQSALGAFPVRAEALRMIPVGTLRHSGAVRIGNDGAVRLEVADALGLIQLAPAQFPGGVDESLRQVFVYRFPSADYSYGIQANQVLPEISVSEITIHELAETDRRISSDVELDIREAPVREWEMEIPADHAVAAVTGSEVADYAVAEDAKDGVRKLKIIFKQTVINRQLVSVRLEKNEAASAGIWELPRLGFPGAKSRRGYVGAVAAPGYRLSAINSTGVVEVPVAFFMKKVDGLQQAFRLRGDVWKISLDVKALGQSVQADVFHLYSLKSGAAYGSVLINYFVVGAPATEWRIAVPENVGNIEVTGQNVGVDSRREGNTMIVPLSSPLLGSATVLLTFEQPMSARGGDLSPGEVRPLDVQSERGYVQVVSPLQVKQSPPVGEGALLKIDSTELPAEYRLLSSAPTLGAWQYTARDFKVGMKVEWYEPGETVEQVVDFLKLSSQISRDGQWVTDARFFVKSRGRGALRTVLPAGASLWDAKVNGEPVNARMDGSETLVPLPADLDQNRAAEISLRYGGRSDSPGRARLGAPKLAAPVVIGEWTVNGDEGRQLVPRGGSAELTRPVLAASGLEWLAGRQRYSVLLLLSASAALGAGHRARGIYQNWVGIVLGLVFIILCVAIGVQSADAARGNVKVLEYAAPVVEAGGEVFVEIADMAAWQARIGWGCWLVMLLAATSLVHGFWKHDGRSKCVGFALAGLALLLVRGGAPFFFTAATLVGLLWWVPRVLRAFSGWRPRKAVEAAAMVLAALTFGISGNAEAAGVQQAKPAESMIQNWEIKDGRVRGVVDVTVRGETGDRFLLLQFPAVLTSFEGQGLRVVKVSSQGKESYFMLAETTGRMTAKVIFEMPGSDSGTGWPLPTGPAALRQITLRWDKAGWEFISPGAAKIGRPADLADGQSGAVIIPGSSDAVIIQARPRQRDVSREETKFFAEISNLYLPGPGVVNGRHRVSVRPAQGRVSAMVMVVPDGFTVSNVSGGPVGTWRFDPARRELRIPMEPIQEQAFELTVETQRSAETLPVDLELSPLRLMGAAGEIGFLALAFAEDSQPASIVTEGLSRVNVEDFGSTLLPKDAAGNPLALIQHAFRYGDGQVVAKVRVTSVAPELRTDSWQLVSLGEDRLLVSTDLTVDVTRSGVFNLLLEVPHGLEIETATGESLSHWTELKGERGNLVTLHLTSKSIGKMAFSLTMTGPPSGYLEKWNVPKVVVRDAMRETGILTVIPERGIKVRDVGRKNVSTLDPAELNGSEPNDSVRAAGKPGALVYRLLQGDWSLDLGIGRLNSWVTAKVLHDTTLREGQVVTRASIGFRIENAALKTLRIRIPGLDAVSSATVRASGPDVADLLPVPGEDGLWEIQFRRGVAGETTVDLEYQRPGKDAGIETIGPILLEGVKQLSYFATIRAGGRLELEAGSLPRGWQRADWSVVESTLGKTVGTAPPLMAFRVADPEGPLPVTLKRHELAELAKLRVQQGNLISLMSPEGNALTAVELQMQVVEKGTLRLKLPVGAELFNVLVNDEGATLVREGADWLFYVFPSADADHPASVRFVYSVAGKKGGRLEGPVLDVPMEKLTWRVLVPEGWKMVSHGGDFDLRQEARMGSFSLEDYQSFVSSKKSSDSRSAVAMLDQANLWMDQGDQGKASLALSNAVRSNLLDAASGEDARVQLRQLKTQQAVLGINTRRQKIVLDNRTSSGSTKNSQLDRAAEVNPVMRGDYNFDPKQFNRFLEGNTEDENSALKEIANRIVSQQLAAEPAPVSLDVTLPERGIVLTFGRSVQVQSQRPMVLEVNLRKASSGVAWLALPLCVLLGLMGSFFRTSKNAA